ncbi:MULTISPECIES: dihydrofolate reductase family protein [unclassified Pseudoalteromonas]|uniref:dihydrofolate reductase family protein n=1 Tax=unclassified Pseudoalteromonas TaxID=194690 RepID=UPI00209743D6|nr:dihydrofolate reductase family protein [Pseudoalteromonas sp. XMcav2-N]MCO7187433.1 dihydrofolate reductase family protein [Pseudoalteromonas sp. XMcav2-N]
MANIVFIATSLDGYIADKHGKLDWLRSVPNPDNVDTGFNSLMARIDAIVMGRNTFDMVMSFDCDWPYTKPVFVVSNMMTKVPQGFEEKVFLLKGEPKDIVDKLNAQGFNELYIDGGVTIQSFLQDDLIDEVVITRFPVLLGGGSPLFGELTQPLQFRVARSEIVLKDLVQTTYVRQV